MAGVILLAGVCGRGMIGLLYGGGAGALIGGGSAVGVVFSWQRAM